tara:strand:+ start:65381 stop:65740 length:360 start_codon:yes stop_codon:yes gene_type:complete
MRKLEPQVQDKEIEYINKNDVYVRVMDLGEIAVLKEIIIAPGQHTWYWIPFNRSDPINIKPTEHDLTSFDDAINRSVCNPYCTVYVFESYTELLSNLKKLIYDDETMPTVYKSREEKEN